MTELRIHPQRFQEDFNGLAQIGATVEGGVSRPTFSPAHLQARQWFAQRIRQAGLELRIDGAGNHSAFLACGPEGGCTLLLGSHLDSVLEGGRYDGVLGVLAALEVLRTVQDAGLRLPVHLEAIDFTDEEGTLVGLLGSAALVGCLEAGELQTPRGGRDALLAGLEYAGLSETGILNAWRDPKSLTGYLELHIEQGPRLLRAGAQIGVVTAIVGICSYRLVFIGRADHAGTTPMLDRLDAAQGAAAFTLAVRQLVMDEFPGCVANVGQMSFSPGAFNIIPARASLALELRSAEAETFIRLEAALLEQAHREAERFGLGLEIEFLGRHIPAPMSEQAQSAITAAAARLNLRHIPLASGAGHDAQMLARVCPAGMIFVPSQGGASHSPREFTEWQDCVNGANVLLEAALHMVGG
jgi:N-carbamoyl-L-amino-acid hydrolase